MNKKIFILTFTLVLLLITSVSKTYAWTSDEMMATQTKHEYGTYYVIDSFYATPNIDAVKTIKTYSKYLICNGAFPEEDKDNDIYMDFGEYSADSEVLVLQPHLGYGKTVYSRMTRPKTIESYDGKAEYVIGVTNYDNVIIMLDGNTFKGNLGDIVNDFFKTKIEEPYRKEQEFYMPYESAAKAGGVGSISRYKEGDTIYMAACSYQIGFNLLKESAQINNQDNVEDPAIYGGNDEIQIDDTPTQKEKTNEYNPFEVIGIVISIIGGILGIYIIYLLIRKIYEIMKG